MTGGSGRFFCLIDADGDGRVEVASVGAETLEGSVGCSGRLHLFANSGTADAPRWTVTVALNDSEQPFRPGLPGPGGHDAVSLAAADLDGDGFEDLLLGTNHQDVMKHAFGVDPKTHRPTAGRIYVARNQGNRDRPEFAAPRVLATKRGPIECFGFVYPLVVDADGDGRLELFVGDHQPGVRVFRQGESKDVRHSILLVKFESTIPPVRCGSVSSGSGGSGWGRSAGVDWFNLLWLAGLL